MSNRPNSEEYIVLDRLTLAKGGLFKLNPLQVVAPKPEAFSNANAPGQLRRVDDVSQLEQLADASAERLKAIGLAE